ncbi:MAG: TonB-dependent receptor [Pseudomonadota bacterium]|nr:TonB-dependent receptor [Pseudomonadota bacterium]
MAELVLLLSMALASPVVGQPAETDSSDPAASEILQANAPATVDDVERARDQEIVVTGRRLDLVGEAISASEGVVGRQEISSRPLLRAGDLLEFVPGLVATQHSGSGKANQYFLRGFNLDHGTDFATFVDAMPVNMRTHGHGQGWTDLNFLIPEAVEQIHYRKGTYHADVGDFSSAGSARFDVANMMPRGVAEVTAGAFGYRRGVVVDSVEVGGGDLLVGGELQTFDGPWTDIDENVRKRSGLLRYSGDVGAGRGHVMIMAYANKWNSPDQIPQRAVDQGLISQFGSIDPTVGGKSSRYSLSGGWTGAALGGRLNAQAYAIDSSLDLYSNFTYLLDDPVNGDQFRQVDERRLYGFNVSQQWTMGRSRWRAGTEGRYDDIGRVGLFRTRDRQPVSTVREDSVEQSSFGLHASNEFSFSDALRTYVGMRYDHYWFDVNAISLPENSGSADDGRFSLKGSVIYKPLAPLELYLSVGQGFHSNDARGTTIAIDPVSGDAAVRVDPLVASIGGEIGARLFLSDRVQATLAAWTLRLDSELLFVGDAGNTEASRPSKRDGMELGIYYFGSRYLSGELEMSYTNSRFLDDDPVGNRIAGSIPLVVSGGMTARADGGWLATARLRYFGKYPLIEDNSAKSDGSLLVNLRAGREWGRFGAFFDVFNLLDSKDHDVDYFYASRLPEEPAEGVEDIHYHVFQPRSVRVSLRFAI